mmetsp:Transcript_6007/g.21198  ORF Transcript_6007/g.21198 Transcript_6007/m.21198 type:complete len:166 (-) Transcript_6007:753-1250(-)
MKQESLDAPRGSIRVVSRRTDRRIETCQPRNARVTSRLAKAGRRRDGMDAIVRVRPTRIRGQRNDAKHPRDTREWKHFDVQPETTRSRRIPSEWHERQEKTSHVTRGRKSGEMRKGTKRPSINRNVGISTKVDETRHARTKEEDRRIRDHPRKDDGPHVQKGRGV